MFPATARSEAARLAKHIVELNGQLKTNDKQLEELIKISEAAPMLEERGAGSWSPRQPASAHGPRGRLRFKATFASLAGVNPIPASSGNAAVAA